MALIYNGTTIEKVVYNGTELDKVIYNGVTVFEKTAAQEFLITVGYRNDVTSEKVLVYSTGYNSTVDPPFGGISPSTYEGSPVIWAYFVSVGDLGAAGYFYFRHGPLGSGSPPRLNIWIEGVLEQEVDPQFVSGAVEYPIPVNVNIRSIWPLGSTKRIRVTPV